ncbi:DUF485 domain-containing protein [Actinomadura alba]|uniref:DUF485 domain-containing protein n=1 Tax=Actinomadura alba TaxID=406431 RepID=A0ABR7LU09_9ACTN|nr:DUF485 domain-containing protein [Actinomadura alba]MBC6468331.1 DUF485 domain-containing protein [Actinomadura alba]
MGTKNSAADGDRYVAVFDSAQFTALRRRSNAFIGWASVIFYGWWLLVILLAAFAPDFYRQDLVGPINVGLLAVFLSFNLVVVVASVYMRFARTQLDPLSERIRADLEGGLR